MTHTNNRYDDPSRAFFHFYLPTRRPVCLEAHDDFAMAFKRIATELGVAPSDILYARHVAGIYHVVIYGDAKRGREKGFLVRRNPHFAQLERSLEEVSHAHVVGTTDTLENSTVETIVETHRTLPRVNGSVLRRRGWFRLKEQISLDVSGPLQDIIAFDRIIWEHATVNKYRIVFSLDRPVVKDVKDKL